MDLKELEELPIEIVELEEKINKIEKENKVSKLKCNMKKIRGCLKLSGVLLSIPIAGTIITTARGWNPFKLNDIEINPIIKTTIDKDYNTKDEIEEDYLNYDCELHYCSDWEKTDKGNYKRKIYFYGLESDDFNKVMSLKGQDLDKKKIDELFGIAYETEEEFLGNVDDRSGYIEAIIRKKDKNKTIVVKERLDAHLLNNIIKILIELLWIYAELSVLRVLKKDFGIKEDLKSEYKIVDVERLKQELEAKRLLFEETLHLVEQMKFDEEINKQKIKVMKM